MLRPKIAAALLLLAASMLVSASPEDPYPELFCDSIEVGNQKLSYTDEDATTLSDMFAPPDLLVDVPGVAWLGNEAVKLVAPVPENLAEQIGLQYSLEQAVGEFIANNGTVACPDTFSVNLIKGCYSTYTYSTAAQKMGHFGPGFLAIFDAVFYVDCNFGGSADPSTVLRVSDINYALTGTDQTQGAIEVEEIIPA